MKTTLRITQKHSLQISQDADITSIQRLEHDKPDGSAPVELTRVMLDDLIQTLELCRDSHRRRRG